MTTDITELTHSNSLRKKLNRRLNDAYGFQRTSGGKHTTISLSIDECKSIIAAMDERLALVEALEKAQQRIAELENYAEAEAVGADRAAEDGVYWMKRCKELESRTVKLPDGWQFEECEIEGCENGAIFSVGTGSRNIHLCDKCAHEPQNSRLKKSPLSKRLPFKMSAGIKVEAE
ncbi:hypothetical protein [Klebsiella quasipneumoniae]|uniref:hypothetical protein n=1 Tax=Klebsiella quasipneumoniae TaxID=1463165 RepID=UPI001FB7B255|nr:hypothetical protein [Klebsiella quasipneumoniae]MCJ1857403.1 hypothetical protein [Klebsiella quasipneumoniae subsp. similipneumoniae]